MRRFLVVGCGGSGGATLRFLMEQLRADLRLAELPKAWQFVHVDVPTAAEAGPGMLRSVPQQRGRYVSMVHQGSNYRDVAAFVDQKLRTSGTLGSTAAWRPEPQSVGIAVSAGAGQYRAIGRVLTLSRAQVVLDALRAAWSDLQGPTVQAEMRELTTRHPNLGKADAARPPIVLVVGSLAGGSGAAMALDVCRLLTLVPGVEAGAIGLFTYLPDVFGALPKSARNGVEANAAASLGELIAAQAGAGGHADAELYKALGIESPKTGAPFARVFPVGRALGSTGAVLGNGQPVDIYRATGRAFAALMGSENASENFMAYDLTNQGTLSVNRSRFGWGIDPERLVWGAFGFASLSLGRDRYAEYAAQRLARGAVDHLLDGHLNPGDARPGSEQVRALSESQWSRFCATVGLPGPGVPPVAWLREQAMGEHVRTDLAAKIRTEVLGDLAATGSSGGEIQVRLDYLRQQVRDRGRQLIIHVDAEAYRWAHAWHLQLRRSIEGAVSAAVGDYGLPYAAGMLKGLARQIDAWVGDLAQIARRVDPATLPPHVEQQVGASRGKLANESAIVDAMLAGYQWTFGEALLAEAGRLVAEVLRSLSADLLDPLAAALREAVADLENARTTTPTESGFAVLATDAYRLWPADADKLVDARFDQAENEVLLISAAEFRDQFDAHVRETVGNRAYTAARDMMIRQIVDGVWETVGGEAAPGSALRPTSDWRPAAMQDDPESGRPLPRSRGAYALDLAPGAVLGRARAFVRRVDEPFERFAQVSLREYLTDPATTALELSRRQETVIQKFTQTLALACPLVGVNANTVGRVHAPDRFLHSYKFSSVPLAGLPLGNELRRLLDEDANITGDTGTRFSAALSTLEVSRIDVFGSYQNYSPVVFSSILAPIAQEWASLTAGNRADGWWRWRRSRPLHAALPCGPEERHALVRGWLVGCLTGAVRPREHQIYDVVDGEWRDLPNPLLTPMAQSTPEPAEGLARVLESMVLAIVACHNDPELGPLRPYQALRRLYDKGEERPTQLFGQPSDGARLLLDWIAKGRTPSGEAPIAFGGSVLLAPAERHAAVLDKLRSTAERMEQYGPAAVNSADLSRVPLLADLAVDLRAAALELADAIEQYDGASQAMGGI